MGIVDSVFEGSRYLGKWAKNAAGGMYNAAAGMAELPAQAGAAAMQLLGGRSPSEIVVPKYMEQGKKTFQDTTGIPTNKADPGFEVPFAFGRGTVGATSLPAAAVSGGLNAVAETVTDDPLLQAGINIGVPLAAAGLGAGVRAVQNRKVNVNNADTALGLTKGQVSGDAYLLSQEAELGFRRGTANAVASKYREQADTAKELLTKLSNKVSKSKDPESGVKAALAWKGFLEGQQAKHKALSEAAFAKLDSKNLWPTVDVAPIKNALKEVIKDNSTLVPSDTNILIRNNAQKMLDNIGDLNKVSLKDIQVNLEHLGAAANPSNNVSFFTDIAPGAQVGTVKKLGAAWQEALKMAAAQPTKNGRAAAELLKTRKEFAVRVNDLKEIADSPLGVFFDKGRTGERVLKQPEKVMETLRNLPKGERDMFVSIMEMTDKSVVDDLRKSILDNIIEKGVVKGAAARDPQFSIPTVLKNLEERADDLKFLMPNPENRKELTDLIGEMKQAVNSAYVSDHPLDIARLGAAGVGMVTGKMGATMGAIPFTTKLADLLHSPERRYQLLFGQTSGSRANKTLEAYAQKVKTSGVPMATAATARTVADNINESVSVQQPQTPQLSQSREPTEYEQEMAPKLQQIPTGQRQGATGPQQETDDLQSLPEPEFDIDDLPDPDESVFSEDESKKKSSEGLDKVLDVVAKVESNNNPKAIGPVTKSGRAKGMYQFTDATAKQFGIDPFDPVQSREGASKYIQQLLKKYDGDLVKALAAYNWGPGNVDKYGLDKAPKETRDYLFKINKGLLE